MAGFSCIHQVKVWRSPLLEGCPRVLHGATSRYYGALRLTDEPRGQAIANRRRLAVENGFKLESAVLAEQVHHNRVAVVSHEQRGAGTYSDASRIRGVDALITDCHDVILIVRTADCTPLLLFDPDRLVVGAVHAGWRGTCSNIAGRTVRVMEERFGVDPGRLLAVVGPCIKGRNYDVSNARDGRLRIFSALFGDDETIIVRNGKTVGLDLAEANRRQCLHAGIKPENFHKSGICTYERTTTWPSYRAGDHDLNHQMWSYIGMVSNG